MTIWYLKRELWSCKQPCSLIGPKLCIWSRVILDWTLLATGNLTSLLEKLLSCRRQLGRPSSLRLKISLVPQRLSLGLRDMLSQKMADQHLQQIISFWLQVKIWNYLTKRVFLSGKGYSTQTTKLIILSSLPQRLTKGFVIRRNARRNPRNMRVGGYIASYTGHEIENPFHVRLFTCTSDIATTPIARRQTCSCNISS